MTADDLRLTRRNEVLIAQPTVEIDLSNAEQLGNRIVEAAPTDCAGIVIDLGEVDYLDSFGICVIVGVYQRFVERAQRLALVVPEDSPVRGTLRIANVQSHLDIFDGMDEALSTLAAEGCRA